MKQKRSLELDSKDIVLNGINTTGRAQSEEVLKEKQCRREFAAELYAKYYGACANAPVTNGIRNEEML